MMVGLPLLVKVFDTIPKPLVLPSGGAVAAKAGLLYANDSSDTKPKLASMPEYFRSDLDLDLAAGCFTPSGWKVVALLLNGMVLNPFWWWRKVLIQ